MMEIFIKVFSETTRSLRENSFLKISWRPIRVISKIKNLMDTVYYRKRENSFMKETLKIILKTAKERLHCKMGLSTMVSSTTIRLKGMVNIVPKPISK